MCTKSDKRATSPSSVAQFSFESDIKQSILIISENMPPQVNGIARRVGMYAEGLRDKGCHVGKILLQLQLQVTIAINNILSRSFVYPIHNRCCTS